MGMPLRTGRDIPALLGRGQRVQHRLHHRGALRRQVAVDHPGPVERGLQGQSPIEALVPLILRVRRGGTGPDPPGPPGHAPPTPPPPPPLYPHTPPPPPPLTLH